MQGRVASRSCRAGLLERLNGDEELLADLMETFLDDVPRQISALQEAIEKDDAPGVRLRAHTIKGASANFGVPGLRSAAARLEEATQAGNLSGVLEGLQRIRKELETFKRVVQDRGPTQRRCP